MNRFWPLTRGLKRHWTSFDPQPGFSKNIKEPDRNATYPKPSVLSGKSHEIFEGLKKLELLLSTVLKVQKLGTNYLSTKSKEPSITGPYFWPYLGDIKLTNYLMMMLKCLVIFERWTSGERKTYFPLTGWIRMEGKISILEHVGELMITWSHDSCYYDWPHYRLYLYHITVPHSLLLPCLCL